jgi:hypothetical protein
VDCWSFAALLDLIDLLLLAGLLLLLLFGALR